MEKMKISDSFLKMSHSAQLLYFYLYMQADTDGYVENPDDVIQKVGLEVGDLMDLLFERYTMPYGNGIVLIENEKLRDFFIRARDSGDVDYEKELKSQVSKPKKPKPVKHKYGEYNNVLLTDDELVKLTKEYPDIKAKIENLSSYMASTGKSYKSHYATIRNWARKEPKSQQIYQGTDLDDLF